LRRQILLVSPEIIVTLGRIAGETIYVMAGLKWRGIREARRAASRGVIMGRSILIYSTFHPAAALYNREVLPMLEEDFRRLKELLSTRDQARRTLLDYM